jgi:hypothetical protein
MRRALIAAAAALAAAAGCGNETEAPELARTAATAAATQDPAPTKRPKAIEVNCSTRSMADFPEPSDDPDNLVAGPLSILGAAHIPAATIERFGGDKVPVLLEPGHRVTLELTRAGHRVASLAYGRLGRGVVRHAEGRRAIRFKPCRRERHSGASAGGREVTFWMGFIVARERACVPLYAWIDDEPEPRRLMLGLGKRDCE